MNAFATITAKFIGCFLLVALLAASTVSAQVIEPPPDGDASLLVDMPLVFNMDTDAVDWENDYTLFPFEGAGLERIPNPDQSAGNTTEHVLQYGKFGGAFWAGFFYNTDEPMMLSDDSRFTLNVWSPKANVPALLKLEMRQFPDVNTGDILVNIPVANEWVTLEWDLSDTEWRDIPFDRVVIILDFQEGGAGGAGVFFFVDDFAYLDTAVSSEPSGEGTQQPVLLYQNFPNPVNSATNISFSMASPGHAVVEVFDVLGQRVTMLVNDALPAGQHETNFDASGLPGGTYIYRLQVGDQVQTRKLTVVN